MNGHRPDCDGCVRCEEPGCPEVAYCVNERPTGNLCDHHAQAVCADHWPGTCGRCQEQARRETLSEEIEDALASAFANAGAAFDRLADDGDPWAELAAESRRIVDRFWDAGGERRRDAS